MAILGARLVEIYIAGGGTRERSQLTADVSQISCYLADIILSGQYDIRHLINECYRPK